MNQPLYPIADPRHFSRRSFLVATTSLAAAAVWSSRALGIVQKNVKVPDQLFTLGVASGDPAPDGFVIWTRLAPRPIEGGGMPAENVEVAWEVAQDEQMTKVVRSGKTVATPDWAHSVHVEVEGLQPDRWYFYRFHASGEESPQGRARTMPQADASPPKLKFAFASCQHYEQGLFTAYDHMAKEDFDLILHLGDYIYEGAGSDKQLRKHVGPLLQQLGDYRNRHAQYKTTCCSRRPTRWRVDRHLGRPRVRQQLPTHFEKATDDPTEYRQRRAAIRRISNTCRSAVPRCRRDRTCCSTAASPSAGWRRFMSSIRGNTAPTSRWPTATSRVPSPRSQATALGEAGKWLLSGLGRPKRWNVLAQQIMMARVDRTAGEAATTAWTSGPAEMNRRRLLNSSTINRP
jgi:alkaline phosphatase D